MSALGRLWTRIKLFFVRATPPPQLPERFEAPPPISDMFESVGARPNLEARESTHVVGMRNPKMTGRTSKTHPGARNVVLTQAMTPELERRRAKEDLADRIAHRKAVHEGPGMIECVKCGNLYPPSDIHPSDHDCNYLVSEKAAERYVQGGSATFHNAHDNVRYLGDKRRKGDA
jgi:hypothetical protein